MAVRAPGLRIGGAVGWAPIPESLRADFDKLNTLAEKIGGPHCLRWLDDPDCLQPFLAAVPHQADRERYVTESARFACGQKADMSSVLIFRRTLPKEDAAPEKYWTSDYTTAVRGLRYEIPEPHRWFTVIVCSTFAKTMADGIDVGEGASSDGEVKMRAASYDQRDALFAFRTAHDQTELARYRQEPDAITLEALRAELARAKESRTPDLPARDDIEMHKEAPAAPQPNQVRSDPLARHNAGKLIF